mmetsp:Transcript_32980/g.78641  ORF Transcript_32980/g.78641 Transcript_32980/m.78641 type:complete len:380 (+) Transcript_32980:81-1220(+)
MGNVEGKEGTGEGDAASTSSSKAAWNFCEPSRVGSSVAGQEVEEVDEEELEERQKSGKGGISWLFRSKVMDMKLDKQTKLHSLACSRRLDTQDQMEYALQLGESVNAQDSVGRTPLHIAARQSDFQSIWFLLSNGADPDIRNDDDQTAEDVAGAYGHTQAQAVLRTWKERLSRSGVLKEAAPHNNRYHEPFDDGSTVAHMREMEHKRRPAKNFVREYEEEVQRVRRFILERSENPEIQQRLDLQRKINMHHIHHSAVTTMLESEGGLRTKKITLLHQGDVTREAIRWASQDGIHHEDVDERQASTLERLRHECARWNPSGAHILKPTDVSIKSKEGVISAQHNTEAALASAAAHRKIYSTQEKFVSLDLGPLVIYNYTG